MTWAKLDDLFPENEKVSGLNDGAFRLHIHALCYAARNLTDGRISYNARRGLGGTISQISALRDAGLWEAHEGGWVIHDYLEYNPSREQVMAQRQKKASAGRKGGEATAKATAVARATPSGKAPVPVPSPIPDPPTSDQAPAVRFVRSTKRNEQVAAIVDLFRANGATLTSAQSGHVAAIIGRYGHGQAVVDEAMVVAGKAEAGDRIELWEGRLRNGAKQTQRRGRGRGATVASEEDIERAKAGGW